jgi:hypothetical protein
VAVSGGEPHSLGLRSNDTLWAWGFNGDGQLGLGDTTDRNIPIQVGNSTNWMAASAGFYHTLGLHSDGTLWTWGGNNVGQLGLGDTTDRNVPTQVGSTTNWVGVSAGRTHTLGLHSDGTLWAWGENDSGRLGLGDTTDRWSPNQVISGILSCQVSFEWGLTASYGEETTPKTMTGEGAFSGNITGLTPGITYHFRAKAVTYYDTVYGDDMIFTTDSGCQVDISVVLQGGSRPPEGWEVPVTIKFFSPGADVMTDDPLEQFDLTTTKSDSTAVCQCSVDPGTYDITTVSEHTLINVKRDVVISSPSTAVDMGTLLEGNGNDDIIINISDLGILAVSYMCLEGEPCYDPRADFDRNGIVNISDLGLLAVNYMKISPIVVPE